nr:hypothetical protein CFP56_09195 [Quercus suber]
MFGGVVPGGQSQHRTRPEHDEEAEISTETAKAANRSAKQSSCSTKGIRSAFFDRTSRTASVIVFAGPCLGRSAGSISCKSYNPPFCRPPFLENQRVAQPPVLHMRIVKAPIASSASTPFDLHDGSIMTTTQENSPKEVRMVSAIATMELLQDLEGAEQGLVDAHHRSSVVEFATVVRGGEECDELTLGEELVAVLDHLMRAAYQIHVVFLQEARHDVRTEREADTPVVLRPAGDVLVGIGPQQVAEETAVRDLEAALAMSHRKASRVEGLTHIGRPHHASDLLHGVEIGAQATVHRENLLVDDGRNGQAVEAIGKGLPQLDVVTSLALVVKTVDTVDRSTFMIAAENEEILGIFDLVCQQQADGFQRLLAAVDVITKKEIVGLWGEATVLEQTEEIVILAVNVTTDLVRSQSVHGDVIATCTKHTLIGASSSRRMGWLMKISRALVQRKRISVSSNCTCFPGLLPRTSSRRSMMLSKSTSFWSAIASGGRGCGRRFEWGCGYQPNSARTVLLARLA